MNEITKHILLYDGECSFCNGAVQWIISRDPQANIHFAAQQGEKGKQIMNQYHINQNIDSLIFIENDQAYLYSSAALRLTKYLHKLWPTLQILLFIPAPIRNYAYRWFAKHRYQWFGKQESCMLPTPEIRARFID